MYGRELRPVSGSRQMGGDNEALYYSPGRIIVSSDYHEQLTASEMVVNTNSLGKVKAWGVIALMSIGVFIAGSRNSEEIPQTNLPKDPIAETQAPTPVLINGLVPFDSAEGCLSQPQPGLVKLWEYAATRWDGLANGGILVCKSNMSGSTSRHSEGRALDIMVPNKEVGEEIKDFLFENKEALQIQQILWDEHCYSSYKNADYRSCGMKRHGDHIHVERNWAGAKDERSIEEIVGP